MKERSSVSILKQPAALLILTTFMLAGCSVKSPQAPSWDTTIRLPLIDKTYTTRELFAKLATDNIVSDSSGNSSFLVEKNLDSLSMDAVLAVSGSSSQFDKQVGVITVPPPPAMAQQIAFSDYVPLIAGEIPDTGLQVNKTVGPNTSFAEAVITEGGLIVTTVNNTGFTLDSLRGEVRDPATAALLGTFTVPQALADGSSFVDTLPLSGKTVHNECGLDVYFHTPGGLALSLAGRSIDFEFGFTGELRASSVTGKVSQFSHQYVQNTSLSDDFRLLSASMVAGNLDFTIQNHLGVSTEIVASFPNITSGGTPLSLTIPVNAYGSVHETRSLSGWTIQPQSDSIRTN